MRFMIRVHQSSRESDCRTGPPLPTKLLKQVLTRHGLRIGGRVLVAGCGRGELVAFLDGLAYSVNTVDDRPDEVEKANQRFPHLQFQCARLDESISGPCNEFDLVLVQDLGVYHDNLMSLISRTVTANLLACLKPGGDLVFIGQMRRQSGCEPRHESRCWKQHLACFPGQLEAHEYRESFFENARWDWLVGRREHNDHFTVTLQSPLDKLTQSIWQDVAQCGLMTGKGSCCEMDRVASGKERRVA
jgi:SAM-dependent methyltransferase